jgi:hypothetical protein
MTDEKAKAATVKGGFDAGFAECGKEGEGAGRSSIRVR